MKKLFTIKTEVVIALIGACAVVIAALITGVFQLLSRPENSFGQKPTPPPIMSPTSEVSLTSTTTNNSNPYSSLYSKLVINDPLYNNAQGLNLDEEVYTDLACEFEQNAYEVAVYSGYRFKSCYASPSTGKSGYPFEPLTS